MLDEQPTSDESRCGVDQKVDLNCGLRPLALSTRTDYEWPQEKHAERLPRLVTRKGRYGKRRGYAINVHLGHKYKGIPKTHLGIYLEPVMNPQLFYISYPYKVL